MELEIICASRTATGKINLKKLRREAIKTRIDPSLEINRHDNVSLSEKGHGIRKKISLSINYNPPTNAVKAYEDLHNYEVLSRDIADFGNLHWQATTAKVKNHDKEFFEKGTWYLIEKAEGYKNQLLEGKIIFSIGIEGVSVNQAQKLSSDFDFIQECDVYKEIGIRDNLPMIFAPVVYFDTFLDSLDAEKINTKLSLLEKLEGSCWGIRDLNRLRERVGETDDADLFSFKKLQPSFYRGEVLIMQGVASKNIIAKYVLEEKPAE